jgi:hypothetical protein
MQPNRFNDRDNGQFTIHFNRLSLLLRFHPVSPPAAFTIAHLSRTT